ncbi:hypothetical protein MSHI_37330 [Mycobacterium shinjukuense]|uniref:HTH araC/xylS-type domain-containing protein n=1 Tax=Mycobacterium shinjukuense TaxID=398694 RepID=A0A7I7MVB1_9MYCO|nr:hypothetical protein MSHI_37330 [Mycobacterium shinjukuense]
MIPAARLAKRRRDGHGQPALRHERFHTDDPDTAKRFFERAYTPGWQIGRLATGSAITHRRYQTAMITVDEVLIEGEFSCDIRAVDAVIVIHPRAGSLTVEAGGEPETPMDAPTVAGDGVPCLLHAKTARFAVVSIATKMLRKVAGEHDAPVPMQIQFLGRHPRSRAALDSWQRALDYVVATFACADTAQRPLIIDAGAQLLAAALLESFPSNVTAAQDLQADRALPRAFKGAVSFIQRHACHDIGINDVAAAVRLTPRAVQYLFRQHLDTTPTEYLRRVRLHRAHQDLLRSDSSATVTEIARRWGFGHPGRFAVLYRETYGQSPHTTLKH